jgi:hypothetical protein
MIDFFKTFLLLTGVVTWALTVIFVVLRANFGKKWPLKTGILVFTGTNLIASIQKLLGEVRADGKPTEETIVEVAVHIFWRLTRLAFFAFIIALLPTILLFQQNNLISDQNVRITEQNNLLQVQNDLLRAEGQPVFELDLSKLPRKDNKPALASSLEINQSGPVAFNTSYSPMSFLTIELRTEKKLHYGYWPITNYMIKYVGDTTKLDKKFVILQGVNNVKGDQINHWLKQAVSDLSGSGINPNALVIGKVRTFVFINYEDIFGEGHNIAYETTLTPSASAEIAINRRFIDNDAKLLSNAYFYLEAYDFLRVDYDFFKARLKEVIDSPPSNYEIHNDPLLSTLGINKFKERYLGDTSNLELDNL